MEKRDIPGHVEPVVRKPMLSKVPIKEANGDNLRRLVGRCGTCRHFRRAHWHPAHGGGEQHGGHCKLICAALKVTNTILVLQDEMYVMETFGCYAHSPNATGESRAIARTLHPIVGNLDSEVTQ